MSRPPKIDVHHHIIPPQLQGRGEGMRGVKTPRWSLQADQRFKHDVGIAVTIFSISTPGISHLPDPKDQAREARAMNEYMAAVVSESPGTRGFFALVPSLQHVDLVLAEIEYAFDHLHADGVGLFTSYGKDQYLGKEEFVPIWEELDRRQAVVFIHPCDNGDRPVLFDNRLPAPAFDWPHETGRTAMDLVLKGRMRKFSHVKVILSHAGGTLALLARRATLITYPEIAEPFITAEELYEQAQTFYFDTALSGSQEVLPLIMGFAREGHLLFGSDYPHATEKCSKDHTRFIDQYPMSEERREEIYHGAARKLFPRFRNASAATKSHL